MAERRTRQQPPQAVAPDPPAHLSPRARELWVAVVRPETKPGRLVMIQTALEALDEADAARAVIEAEGLTLPPAGGRGMTRINPACRVEKDARQAFASLWQAMRLQW